MAKPSSRAAKPAGGTLFDNLLKRQRAAAVTATPFVSVVCPTWNRREFLPYLLYIFQYQDYPADKRELVILDDSEHSNEDLIAMMVDAGLQNVHYIHSKERLALGKKRNMLNELAQGEYIICFDDDDYYPPNKISYQVGEMQRSNALFSGCDQIYIWYSHLDKIYLTHSFGDKHALNCTFGTHRNLLQKNRYQDEATLAEEEGFLKGYTTPVLQLDPMKTLLLISHNANTFDKDFILGSSKPQELQLEDFVTDTNLLAHYRRLSHAPLNTRVDWSKLDKIAVIYDPAQREMLDIQCAALSAVGIPDERLIPIARHTGSNREISELDTHCEVLQMALDQGWKSVTLFDSTIKFVKKESAVTLVNKLLSQLPKLDWHVLLFGAAYDLLAPVTTLKGVARIRKAESACAYSVNGPYVQTLLESYQQAKQEQAGITKAWHELMPQHCWIGFYPSIAFIQNTRDFKTGRDIDCTHWFFRKHS
jgi:glycosyltransferase involved in cell wall biosynthesis